MTEQRKEMSLKGPTDKQVHAWFQESTIHHHVTEDGSHVAYRAIYVAQKAWEAGVSHGLALVSLSESQ